MTQYFLFAWLAIASLGVVAQQTASFEGTITNEKGSPLQGITVLLKSQQKGALTDAKGRFTFQNIQPTPDTIEVFGTGFERKKFEVVFQAGETQTQSITLQEEIIETDEVVIVGESAGRELEKTAKAVKVIELQEVKLKAADLGEIMAQTEGISVQRGGGLGSGVRFALNGLSGDQVRFFYDGIPLGFSPYAFGIANVPVNMIDRVEVYKGVVPIELGADALGGAVNLVSPSTYHGISGSASYQVGSFNTHRATANLSYANDSSGFFAAAGGFYDFTDNNYKIDVAIPNERGQLQQQTVERFHDGYRAYGINLKLGIRNRKWADELSLEGYYGNYYNEIQNSQSPGLVDQPSLGIDKAIAGIPFGEVLFTSFSQGLNLNYHLTPGSRWDLDLRIGYNDDQRTSIDTSRNRYNWLGEVSVMQNVPGEFARADHLITTSRSVFVRQQLTYTFSDQHQLKLSLAPTYGYRTPENLLPNGVFDPTLDEGYLFDLVSGLEYTADLLDSRLQNIAFVKNYRQSIRIESMDLSVNEVLIDERTVSNYGAGNGLRYNWSPRFSTKLSYEFAYRMPRQDEIFGDGLFVLENLEIQPENSHNVNFQWRLTSNEEKILFWEIEGNLFLRQTDNLIFFLVDRVTLLGRYENVFSATSQGLEIGTKINNLFVKGLSLNANSTYLDYTNTSDEGLFAGFRGERLPNVPYFFFSTRLDYSIENIFKASDKINIFWNSRYVDSFLLGWESVGRSQSKQEVPSQFIQGAGVIHKMNIKDLQFATTLEMANVTNAKVFDFFGVQRPGRAFYVKLSTQF
ncbi:MAG: TonB-dependent receptor plug domain-containing protein [Bacteroidota bacterium]